MSVPPRKRQSQYHPRERVGAGGLVNPSADADGTDPSADPDGTDFTFVVNYPTHEELLNL